MKKILGILVIAGTMVACNNEGGNGTNTEDSLRRADSLRREDSIRNAASSITPGTNTNDSLNAGNDSLNRAGKDSVK